MKPLFYVFTFVYTNVICNDCLFISNKEQYAGLDGLHLTAESHKYLAKSIAYEILNDMKGIEKKK